jgi:LAGLIDADG endonuclease
LAALALNIGKSTISNYLARNDQKLYKNQYAFKRQFSQIASKLEAKCGNVRFYREAIYFRVEKFSDIINIIIPFFTKYPI